MKHKFIVFIVFIVFIFFLPIKVFAVTTTFSVEHLGRERVQESSRVQRTIIGFEDSMNINEQTRFFYFIKGSQNYANETQHVAEDEKTIFELEFLNFYFESSYQSSKLSAGVQANKSNFFCVENITAPGIRFEHIQKKYNLSTSYLSLPSLRKFYVKKMNQDFATLWTTSIQVRPIKYFEKRLELSFGYHYFKDLGPNIAFQSRMRGNDIFGHNETASFSYDFSIISTGIKYSFWFAGAEFSTTVEASRNLSAYNHESNISRVVLEGKKKRNNLSLSLFSIEKNAMVAIFTDELIDSTSVEGVTLGNRFEVSEDFFSEIKLTRLNSKINNQNSSSLYLSLNFRK